jgi:ADP-ribose pyrophosphatase YjhB (NUDIX family)
MVHYENPKLVVGCLPLWKGKILLAKRAIEPRKGLWNLPCGFLENGETVQEGALREVFEETGASVTINHLHCIYDLPHAQQVYMIFHATLLSDSFLRQTSESLEVALFTPEEVPWEDIAFSSTSFAIDTYINSSIPKVYFGKFDKTKS